MFQTSLQKYYHSICQDVDVRLAILGQRIFGGGFNPVTGIEYQTLDRFMQEHNFYDLLVPGEHMFKVSAGFKFRGGITLAEGHNIEREFEVEVLRLLDNNDLGGTSRPNEVARANGLGVMGHENRPVGSELLETGENQLVTEINERNPVWLHGVKAAEPIFVGEDDGQHCAVHKEMIGAAATPSAAATSSYPEFGNFQSTLKSQQWQTSVQSEDNHNLYNLSLVAPMRPAMHPNADTFHNSPLQSPIRASAPKSYQSAMSKSTNSSNSSGN